MKYSKSQWEKYFNHSTSIHVLFVSRDIYYSSPWIVIPRRWKVARHATLQKQWKKQSTSSSVYPPVSVARGSAITVNSSETLRTFKEVKLTLVRRELPNGLYYARSRCVTHTNQNMCRRSVFIPVGRFKYFVQETFNQALLGFALTYVSACVSVIINVIAV